MSWIQLIWFIITNLKTIIKVIRELIDIINGLTGEPQKDERAMVRNAQHKGAELMWKSGIARAPDLVKE